MMQILNEYIEGCVIYQFYQFITFLQFCWKADVAASQFNKSKRRLDFTSPKQTGNSSVKTEEQQLQPLNVSKSPEQAQLSSTQSKRKRSLSISDHEDSTSAPLSSTTVREGSIHKNYY